MKSIGNCLIGQSGGPTPAINASLGGIVSEIMDTNCYQTIYGMVNGIEGLLKDQYINISNTIDSPSKLQTLMHSPSMFLGSCRFKLPDATTRPDIYTKLFTFFEQMDIQTVFYIGGNDSMDTVLQLSEYAKKHNKNVNILGIPKTIDNDLPITDHTPGFGSAAKYIATTMLEIAHDTYIYNIPSVTIVEIMGRNAGWLTAASTLARTNYSTAPDLIYLPEIPFNQNRFISDIKKVMEKQKNVIIAVSEGLKDAQGEYLSASSTNVDSFGHKQLCGTAKALSNIVKNTLGCKVRAIELSVLQRAAAHTLSQTDLNEAVQIGKEAAKLGKLGETGKMLCYHRLHTDPYTIEITPHPITEVANKEKCVPMEWITEDKCNVTEEMLAYLKPLILGQVSVTYKDGIPVYADISHLHQH